MGEHLPCKQGVKSSNLSISTWTFKEVLISYLENCISNEIKKNEQQLSVT